MLPHPLNLIWNPESLYDHIPQTHRAGNMM